MPRWTSQRKAHCVRNPNGTFKKWMGGKTRAQDPRDSSRRGLYTHLTADFKRQTGRAPKVGDIHRRQNLDGSHHRQSFYYIRTPRGWRRSKTEQRRPTQSQVKAQSRRSR